MYGTSIGFKLHELALVDADQGGTLHQAEVGRQRRDRPADETDNEVPSTPAKRAKGCFEQRAAHGIEHDPERAAGKRSLEPVAPAFDVAIEGEFGTISDGEGALLGRRGPLR